MKKNILMIVIISLPMIVSAQEERKGWYANFGLGYGSYKLDIYNYNGGSGTYADQKITQPVLAVGIENKSLFEKNNFVLDAGAELNGSFLSKTKSISSGLSQEEKNGWSLGINALAKAGYLLSGGNGNIVPLIGVGPYFISSQSGSGNDSYSNKIYGIQGFAGVDINIHHIIITPNIQWGCASWGNSDRAIGRADNAQNGQPSMFRAGVSIGIKL